MMRSLVLKATGAAVVLAFVASAPSAYAWRAYDHWQSNWRAAVLRGDWDGVIVTGSPDPRIGQAVLGKYPYHDYGYNNGACIGYEWVCDPWGNIIGRQPVLVC
jgi:hypothetical protein